MRNKFYPAVLLILISILFIFPLLTNDFYLSHDGEAHVARFAAYYKALAGGQFPLRWAGDLNYGYGSPVFIFYYPLPGLLSIPIHALGISFENTFKLLIGFFFSLSFVTFYLWAAGFVKKETAFLGSLLYGLAPYHFLNLYVRGDIAEVIALAIAPLVFLFIKKSIEFKSSNFIVLASLSYALLILSHNAVSLIFSPVILIYTIMLSRNIKDVIFGLIPIILGLILSSFFWIPALVESQYTNAKLFIGDMFKDHFPSVQQLIYSPWGFGPYITKTGGLSPQIGIINLSLAIGAMGLLAAKFKEKKMVIFWAAVFVLAIVLTLNISTFIWQDMPLLRFVQFPWRMLSLASFGSVVLALYLLDKFFDKKLIFILSAVVIVYSLSFLKIQPVNSESDSFYLMYKGTTYYHGQASSIWTAGDFSTFRKSNVELIGGKGRVEKVFRTSNRHIFEVDAETDVRLLDNTVYFPGWQVLVDGNKTPIQFQDPNHRGLITFIVPKGSHLVKVYFGESPTRLLSDIMSLAGILIVSIVIISRSKIDRTIRLL